MVYISLLIAMTGMIEKRSLNPAIGLWILHIIYTLIGAGLLLGPEFIRRRKVKKL